MPTLKAAVLLIALLACTACKRTPVIPQSTLKPFRPAVRFHAYHGAPPKFAVMDFQVNASGRSEFLKLGDTIPNITIRLSDFDPATKELIVTDTATNQRARLAPPKLVDSPPTF
jgi:hypothetical protein